MEFASTLIALAGVLIALAALGISIWVGRLASKQVHAAKEQVRIAEDAAKEQVRIAEEQLQTAEEQIRAAKEQVRAAERDLTLTAYNNAIQEGILDLKHSFAERPEIFEKQVELNPEMRQYIPAYMDTATFLTFAGAMWRLSYVFSVWQRGENLGLSQAECDGLKNEILLWLRYVPGFYDIYRSHVSVLKVHNPDFLAFLENEVYNEEYLRKRDLSPAA